jgi:hypothetical protein
VVAELSAQNASSSPPARAGSSSSRADQASRAHTAPPEVPLRPTISTPVSSSAPSSRLSTPAVKAVWLPPPWQAMATRSRPISVIGPLYGSGCLLGCHAGDRSGRHSGRELDVFYGYLLGAALMIAAGVAEWFIGVEAAPRPSRRGWPGRP